MYERSLNGIWDFRWDDHAPWQPLAVPGCWDTLGPKTHSGPCTYRTTLDVAAQSEQRWWLRFDAVSYACTVYVNGLEVGQHLGLWDAFEFEITDVIAGSTEVELVVRVEKPASLTDGPASPSVPGGRYPTPETLAGFLPYVWGHIFGGIWQSVTLRATGRIVIVDLDVRGDASGAVDLALVLSDDAAATLTFRDPQGGVVWTEQVNEREYRGTMQIADVRPWSPSDPALYELSVEVADGDRRTVRFGCRTVGTSGTQITLNGAAVYPRMALSWGWYADTLHSNPGPERVRADFARLRELGYNGVKLCLWFPPQYYFDLAGELGILLWLEFPMWLPKPTAFFREQTAREYMRLVAQAVRHPSIIVYTLGCELSGDVGGDILEPLFREVKRLVGDALVRDNSGSGEAYGGLLNESAEFYDYHFYADIQFFRNLLDFWTPRWRPVLPWMFGEYCDSDTFRDLRPLQERHKPWWIEDSPDLNPKGARWQFDVVDQERRLHAIGMWERSAELQRISEAQSLLHRKYTLEFTRTYQEISGYVITGEVDTPISTAGMLDDRGHLKFDAAAFRAFNGDTVLLVGWDKRRVWYAGGDRSAYWDTWCYHAGDMVRPHIVVSHYGAATPATLGWEIAWDDGTLIASGEHPVPSLEPAQVRDLTIAAFAVPPLDTPRRAVLRATLAADGWTTGNQWELWCFPKVTATDTMVMLHDPAGRLSERGTALPYTLVPFDAAMQDVPLLSTAWNDDIARFVEAGGRALVLVAGDEPSPVAVVQAPFWREAVKVIEPHAAWGDFPHTGSVGLQFYGCASDRAMNTSALDGTVAPILRRVDARTMALEDYAVEWRHGAGRAILTTLRFEGGLGDQPLGLGRNTAAAYLLGRWLGWLQER